MTANTEVLNHPPVISLADSMGATPAQVVFVFARSVGMLPMTGTSNADHMKQDLASRELELTADMVQAIESIAG